LFQNQELADGTSVGSGVGLCWKTTVSVAISIL